MARYNQSVYAGAQQWRQPTAEDLAAEHAALSARNAGVFNPIHPGMLQAPTAPPEQSYAQWLAAGNSPGRSNQAIPQYWTGGAEGWNPSRGQWDYSGMGANALTAQGISQGVTMGPTLMPHAAPGAQSATASGKAANNAHHSTREPSVDDQLAARGLVRTPSGAVFRRGSDGQPLFDVPRTDSDWGNWLRPVETLDPRTNQRNWAFRANVTGNWLPGQGRYETPDEAAARLDMSHSVGYNPWLGALSGRQEKPAPARQSKPQERPTEGSRNPGETMGPGQPIQPSFALPPRQRTLAPHRPQFPTPFSMPPMPFGNQASPQPPGLPTPSLGRPAPTRPPAVPQQPPQHSQYMGPPNQQLPMAANGYGGWHVQPMGRGGGGNMASPLGPPGGSGNGGIDYGWDRGPGNRGPTIGFPGAGGQYNNPPPPSQINPSQPTITGFRSNMGGLRGDIQAQYPGAPSFGQTMRPPWMPPQQPMPPMPPQQGGGGFMFPEQNQQHRLPPWMR